MLKVLFDEELLGRMLDEGPAEVKEAIVKSQPEFALAHGYESKTIVVKKGAAVPTASSDEGDLSGGVSEYQG